MYVDDHQGRYPYLRSLPDTGNEDAFTSANNRWWFARLSPYYPVKWTDRAYHCPGYKGAITGVADNHDPLGSYAYNARGVRPPFGYRDPSRGIAVRFPDVSLGLGPTLYVTVPGTRPPTPEPLVRVPSQMFAIGESRFADAKVNGTPGGRCDMLCGCLTLPRWNEFAFDPARHGTTYNQLFCDGRVAALSPWVLFNPTNTAAMWNHDNEPHPELWCPDY
jgi:prepilin-type processing-associated H-X9-DG protein